MSLTITPIAHIVSEFPQKFGIPRQPRLAPSSEGHIVFEPDYRNPDCIRGLEASSHIWLIWEFSEFSGQRWQPLVRPPRLGGNRKMGVFATRSPLRPNGLAISAVRIERIEMSTPSGPVIHVSGADIMSGTPIYDIKPYIPFADSIPEASTALFHEPERLRSVRWTIPASGMEPRVRSAIDEILLQDPRPAYKKQGSEPYAFEFAGWHIEFYVAEFEAVVTRLESIK